METIDYRKNLLIGTCLLIVSSMGILLKQKRKKQILNSEFEV